MGCMKLESFCKAKETINRVKSPTTEWEKIFAEHLSEKGLISTICIYNNSKS
jgi:hypothetical protein